MAPTALSPSELRCRARGRVLAEELDLFGSSARRGGSRFSQTLLTTSPPIIAKRNLDRNLRSREFRFMDATASIAGVSLEQRSSPKKTFLNADSSAKISRSITPPIQSINTKTTGKLNRPFTAPSTSASARFSSTYGTGPLSSRESLIPEYLLARPPTSSTIYTTCPCCQYHLSHPSNPPPQPSATASVVCCPCHQPHHELNRNFIPRFSQSSVYPQPQHLPTSHSIPISEYHQPFSAPSHLFPPYPQPVFVPTSFPYHPGAFSAGSADVFSSSSQSSPAPVPLAAASSTQTEPSKVSSSSSSDASSSSLEPKTPRPTQRMQRTNSAPMPIQPSESTLNLSSRAQVASNNNQSNQHNNDERQPALAEISSMVSLLSISSTDDSTVGSTATSAGPSSSSSAIPRGIMSRTFDLEHFNNHLFTTSPLLQPPPESSAQCAASDLHNSSGLLFASHGLHPEATAASPFVTHIRGASASSSSSLSSPVTSSSTNPFLSDDLTNRIRFAPTESLHLFHAGSPIAPFPSGKSSSAIPPSDLFNSGNHSFSQPASNTNTPHHHHRAHAPQVQNLEQQLSHGDSHHRHQQHQDNRVGDQDFNYHDDEDFAPLSPLLQQSQRHPSSGATFSRHPNSQFQGSNITIGAPVVWSNLPAPTLLPSSTYGNSHFMNPSSSTSTAPQPVYLMPANGYNLNMHPTPTGLQAFSFHPQISYWR